MIGYVCAYLRYYYPVEFISAFLNCSETEEDFAAGNTLAEVYGVRIEEPIFRHSKADYFFEKENKVIYKGMASIKFLNVTVANELYLLRDKEYRYFVDLLCDAKETSITTRQLEILIKLDYFKEFGNCRELMQIYRLFEFFKFGKAKQIKKEKLEANENIYGIVSRHSKNTEKQFTQINCTEVLKECEEYLRCQNIQDIPFKDKIKNEIEYLGYVSLRTGKQADRPKLIVLEKKTMISKFGEDKGKPWAVSVKTQSVGSGIKNSFTIPYNKYKANMFEKHDVIYVESCNKNAKGYWYINKYQKVEQ